MIEKPKPKYTLTEMLEELDRALFPDYQNLYDGPGAFTAKELVEKTDATNHQNARSRARKAVQRGEMVEVEVLRRRTNGGAFTTAAWVLKSVYDEWEAAQVKAR